MSNATNKVKETVVEGLTAYGASEIVIREGKAQEVFSPLAVSITGTLPSPFKWLEKRVTEIDQLAAHVLVDRNLMSITFIEKETNHFKNTIIGRLELHPVFVKFNINSGVYLTAEKLAEFFKMNRSFFENQSSAMELVSELKNFKAKVETQIEKSTDNRANTKASKVQAVESNLPEKFNLYIPIFKGMPKFLIEVEVYINPDDLTCTLVSPAANDTIEQVKDDAIDQVLKAIHETAPNLVVIEQ